MTHVAAGYGGSVKFPVSSTDGVAATAGCGTEPMFKEGIVATQKRNE